MYRCTCCHDHERKIACREDVCRIPRVPTNPSCVIRNLPSMLKQDRETMGECLHGMLVERILNHAITSPSKSQPRCLCITFIPNISLCSDSSYYYHSPSISKSSHAVPRLISSASLFTTSFVDCMMGTHSAIDSSISMQPSMHDLRLCFEQVTRRN